MAKKRDNAWKDILIECFDEAMIFFLPELAAARDPSREAILLREELPVIDGDDDRGMRVPDVVVSVPLKDGGEQRVAVVIEQQHKHDPDFPLRMFEGFYRTSDRMRMPVSSLAIFTGDIPEPDRYEYARFGTNLLFQYNVYGVAGQDEENLRADERSFAVVVLAARLMLRADGDPRDRGKYALELLRLMRERNYDNETKRNILTFVGRILRLKDNDIDDEVKGAWNMIAIPLEQAVREIKIRNAYEDGMEEGMEKGLEEGMERGMEKGVEKGIEKGVEKGKIEVAATMFKNGLSIEDVIKFTGLSRKEIENAL